MELKPLYDELLNEQQIVYHGTDANYNDLDLDQVGSADGKSIGGWGIYFTDDYNVAQQYITNKGKIFKYQFKRGGDFFDLDDMLSSDVHLLQSHINKSNNISDEDKEEFQTDFVDYADDTTLKQVYEWLSYVLGSEKHASLFLKSIGYEGNKFKDKTAPSVTNYVVYDLSVIKKLNFDD